MSNNSKGKILILPGKYLLFVLRHLKKKRKEKKDKRSKGREEKKASFWSQKRVAETWFCEGCWSQDILRKVVATMLFNKFFIALIHTPFPYSIQIPQGNTDLTNGFCESLWWGSFWENGNRAEKVSGFAEVPRIGGMLYGNHTILVAGTIALNLPHEPFAL